MSPGSRRGPLARGYRRLLNSYKIQSLLPTIVGVDTDAPAAALTFDDGPDPVWTPKVLDTLARHDARGTFFLLGRNVAAHPALTRRIVAEGHAVGNHTFDHSCLAEVPLRQVVRELGAGQQAIRAATGQSTRLMRPPFGAQNVDTYLTSRALGYQVIHWSASSQDWRGDPAEVLASRIMSAISPGGIVLMHDSWQPPPPEHAVAGEPDVLADRAPTLAALELVIPALQAQGYRLVTVADLLAMGRPRRLRWFWNAA